MPLLVSCAAESEVAGRDLGLGELSAERHDSAGNTVLELSHSPSEIVADGVDVVLLKRDLRVGQDDPWFGRATDVAALGGGRFAVFDNMRDHIMVIDSAGREVDRYGREGNGPGEYQFPKALETVGSSLVAWQSNASSTFTVLDSAGTVVGTGARGAKGDWVRPSFRWPSINMDGLQQGPEDVTRRIHSFGESGFIVALGQDEFDYEIRHEEAPFSWDAPPVHLIRYGVDGEIRDTLATLIGAPIESSRGRSGRIHYVEPVYSGRPVWATGDEWLATGHGNSSAVVVRELAGDTMLSIHWPDRNYEVLDREKFAASRWMIAFRVLNSETSREIFEEASAEEVEAGIRMEALELRSFADQAPGVTAAYGVGSCLFLAGYAPDDWADATSLTWLAVDVRRGDVESIFRIPPPRDQGLVLDRNGAAVRDFDEDFVYTTFRDGDGVFLVERYRLPQLSCASNTKDAAAKRSSATDMPGGTRSASPSP